MSQVMYGVRELQAHLGDALRAARRGEQVVITSHGRPVAVLTRFDARLPRDSAADRKLRRLAAEGRIRLGNADSIRAFDAPAIGGLSDQVRADRR
jgi:prevent-host-death family protein